MLPVVEIGSAERGGITELEQDRPHQLSPHRDRDRAHGTPVMAEEFIVGQHDARRVVRQLDEAGRARLLASAAGYRANMARFRAGMIAV